MFERLFESRSNAFQSVWAAGESVDFGTLAGTTITSENVLQVNAVFSAVSLISDTISTLPLDVFIRRDGARYPFRPAPAWIQQPDVDFPSKEGFYSAVITSLLIDGNAFIRVFANAKGEIVNLVVLNPTHVEVIRNGLGRLMFKINNEEVPLTSDDVVFIPDLVRPGHIRGASRVEMLKENFGLALALEKFASTFFGQGTNLAGVIEFPGNLTADQADQLAAGFDSRHKGWRRGHKTGVLSGGATFKQTQTDPEKATLNSSRDQAVMDVARAFNVPPVSYTHLRAHETG
jgi:HK97 family phage portal protein